VRLGKKLGRTLGFPTANLALQRKVVPLWGIFAVRVSGAGLVDHPAVSSLGTRPTVNGTDPLLEVHLFDFESEIYGALVSVEFVKKLREERKYETLDALAADDLICTTLGETLTQQFLSLKRAELADYEQQVSDWELQRYVAAF